MTPNTSAVAVCCFARFFEFGMADIELPPQLGIFPFEGGLPVFQHRPHVPVPLCSGDRSLAVLARIHTGLGEELLSLNNLIGRSAENGERRDSVSISGSGGGG